MKSFTVTYEIPGDIEEDFGRYVKAMQDYTDADGGHPFEHMTEEECFRNMMMAGSYPMLRDKLWEHMYYHIKCITRDEYRMRILLKQIKICERTGISISEYEKELRQLLKGQQAAQKMKGEADGKEKD